MLFQTPTLTIVGSEPLVDNFRVETTGPICFPSGGPFVRVGRRFAENRVQTEPLSALFMALMCCSCSGRVPCHRLSRRSKLPEIVAKCVCCACPICSIIDFFVLKCVWGLIVDVRFIQKNVAIRETIKINRGKNQCTSSLFCCKYYSIYKNL